jgi:hypothetical protein
MDHDAMPTDLNGRLDALRDTLGRVAGSLHDAEALTSATSDLQTVTSALAETMAVRPETEGVDRLSLEALREDVRRIELRLRTHVQVLSGFGSYLKADISRG